MQERAKLLTLPVREQKAAVVHPRYARVDPERLPVCLAVEVAHLTPEGLAAVSWAVAAAVLPEEDPRQVLMFSRHARARQVG
jgi:hypothetical protein